MEYRISNSSLSGEITLPSSKSQTIRALIFAILAEGTSIIYHFLDSRDICHLLAIMKNYGICFEKKEHLIKIQGVAGKMPIPDDILQVGNSGLLYRFFVGLAALSDSYTIITGDSSIRYQRPIQSLLDALKSRGVLAISMRGDGRAPIMIKGPMQPGFMIVEGADSQFVSSLLVATSFLNDSSEIFVKNPGERPWIDLTLYWLNRLDCKIKNDNYSHYFIQGKAKFSGFNYEVPGDFSSAAFPIIAALITHSSISILNIDMEDPQGDKKIIPFLQEKGALIEYDEKRKKLTIFPSSRLVGGEVDINDFVDTLPILAVLGCFMTTPLEIKGASIARRKESNRLQTIAFELSKMGGKVEEREDGLLVIPSELTGTLVESHHDHRIAMALLIAGLGAKGTTTVRDVECIEKTYPSFYEDFSFLGAHLEGAL